MVRHRETYITMRKTRLLRIVKHNLIITDEKIFVKRFKTIIYDFLYNPNITYRFKLFDEKSRKFFYYKS